MKERIAIIDGIRTPFCKSGGVLKDVPADDLGAYVVSELMARTQFPGKDLDEVIFGNVIQPIEAANVARVIALKAGLPEDLIAFTVHRNCASGMEALTTAANKIAAGESEVLVVGGTESMSHAPLLFSKKMTAFFMRLMRAKSLGQKLGVLASFRPYMLKPVVALELGLTDPVCGLIMGLTAENLAREFHITREEQDAFALQSHEKALQAQKEGKFAEEIFPIPSGGRVKTMQENDDGPRPGQTIEALAKLRPYFDRTCGTVTVGNACPITDGAAAMLVMSESKARSLGLTPLGYLREYAYAALDGARMGLGPVYAAAKLFDKTGIPLEEYKVVEINEAFATVAIGNQRAFASDAFAKEHLNRDKALGEIDPAILNCNGGAIALGHPVGATGARLILTVLKELRRRKQNLGLASLCIGGGQGAALALEVE